MSDEIRIKSKQRAMSRDSRAVRPWMGLVALLLLLRILPSAYPLGYLDNESLAKHLKSASANHSQRVHLTQVAETLKKNPVWLLELGTGIVEERKRRPALLLVAGIEGNDLAGTSSAVFWMQQLLDGHGTGDPIGLKKELAGASEPGAFSDWIYFHYGRLSLASRPWSPTLQVELAKTKTETTKEAVKAKEETRAGDAKPEPNDVDQDSILSGSKRFLLGAIEGSGGMREVRCTLRAKGRDKLGIEVTSALGGTVATTIELKPGQ